MSGQSVLTAADVAAVESACRQVAYIEYVASEPEWALLVEDVLEPLRKTVEAIVARHVEAAVEEYADLHMYDTHGDDA